MAFDLSDITTEADLAAQRLARLARFRAEPLPQRAPLSEADHAAIRAEADRLYASGYGKNQAYDGLQDSIAFAHRKREG